MITLQINQKVVAVFDSPMDAQYLATYLDGTFPGNQFVLQDAPGVLINPGIADLTDMLTASTPVNKDDEVVLPEVVPYEERAEADACEDEQKPLIPYDREPQESLSA